MVVKRTHRRKTYRRKTQHGRKTYRKKRVNSKRNKVGRKQRTYKKLKGGSIEVKQGGRSSPETDLSRSYQTSVANIIESGYMSNDEDEVRKAEVSGLQQSTIRDNPSSGSRRKGREKTQGKKSRKRESRERKSRGEESLPPVAQGAWSTQPEPDTGCWGRIRRARRGRGQMDPGEPPAQDEREEEIEYIEEKVKSVKRERNDILKSIPMKSIPVTETDPRSSVQPVEKYYAEINSDQQRGELMDEFSRIEDSLFKLHVRAYMISDKVEADGDLESKYGRRIRLLIETIMQAREINYIMKTILQKKNLLINPEYAVAMLNRARLSDDFAQFVERTDPQEFKDGRAMPPVKVGTVESPLRDAFSKAQLGAGNLSERGA